MALLGALPAAHGGLGRAWGQADVPAPDRGTVLGARNLAECCARRSDATGARCGYGQPKPQGIRRVTQGLPHTHRLARGILIAANRSECGCLCVLVSSRGLQEHAFLNRRGQPLTRFGIHAMVERYARKVATELPSVAKKRVSPHTIRHTTATHLLRSGVDINTIRAWLGHVSLATTYVYAEVDLEMKAKALANCEVKEDEPKKPWREDKGLMEFLRTL
jgi:integrase